MKFTRAGMSYIIGNKCVGVCDTGCVTVCPVDCINGPIDIAGMGKEVEGMTEEQKQGLQLYIDPEECIDCGACVPECPVDAIKMKLVRPPDHIPQAAERLY